MALKLNWPLEVLAGQAGMDEVWQPVEGIVSIHVPLELNSCMRLLY
jgi:hypothetical protein